jgi:hypothetical protein
MAPAREPLSFELLRVEPPYPRIRVALRKLRVESDGRAQAEVPAGIEAGNYRLVVRRGPRWRMALHRIRVEAHLENKGPAVPVLASANRPSRGEGGRLVLTGANLSRPVLVTLHGPLKRSLSIRPEVRRLDAKRAAKASGPPRVTVPGVTGPRRPNLLGHHGHDHGHGHGEDAERSAREAAKEVGKTPRPLSTQMPIIELSPVREVHGTRMLARLPGSLAPGLYYVQAYTSTHRGNEPEVTFSVDQGGAGVGRAGHLAWLALLLGLSLLGVAVFARPRRLHTGEAFLLAGTAAACLIPLFLLL